MMRQLAVLMWKDWRETRALFVGLTIGAVLWMLTVWGIGGWDRRAVDVLFPAGAIFILFAAAALPAAAIAGERRAGTLRFLDQLPIRTNRAFLSKALVSGTLTALLIGLIAGSQELLVGRACIGAEAFKDIFPETPHPCPGMPEHLPMWFFCFLLASAVIARPLLAPVVGLAFVYIVTEATWYVSPLWMIHAPIHESPRLGAVQVALICGVCLWPGLLAWRVFARVRSDVSFRSVVRAGRGAVGLSALVLIALGATSAAVTHMYRRALRPADADVVALLHVSPSDPNRLALTLRYTEWPFREFTWRACFLDVRTGEATLLTRMRQSYAFRPPWSPDGRFVACTAVRSWPHEFLERERSRIVRDETFFDCRVLVHEPTTGRTSTAGAGENTGDWFLYWLDDSHVLLRGDGLKSYSTETQSLEPWQLPEPDEPKAGSSWYDAMYTRWDRSYRSRLYFVRRLPDGDEQLAVYNCRTERWRLHKLPHTLEVLDVSPDGSLALTHSREPEHDRASVQLLSLDDGTTVTLDTGTGYWGSYESAAFSPDGQHVLLQTNLEGGAASDQKLFRLYHIRSGSWRRVSSDPALRYSDATFTPDGKRIVWGRTYRPYGDDDPSSIPRFHVYDIATTRLRPLVVRCTSLAPYEPNTHTAHSDGVYFTCGRAVIYHIKLDGTGLERVFPTKQALTLAEFEAEAGR